MNRQPIVQLSNLSWTFREGETRRQVLDHITFDFEPYLIVVLPLPSRCNWWPRWWLLLAY